MTETSEQNPGQTSEANKNNRGAHIGMDGWGGASSCRISLQGIDH